MRHQQEVRFRQRDNEHRSFIRAYLFDLIFKSFVSILDECLSQRDRLLAESKEEWQYFADKQCSRWDASAQHAIKQLAKREAAHQIEVKSYERRLEALKEENSKYQKAIQDYKAELRSLADGNKRNDILSDLRNHLFETQEFLVEVGQEMQVQAENILPVLNMVNTAAKPRRYSDRGVQTEVHIGADAPADDSPSLLLTSGIDWKSVLQKLKPSSKNQPEDNDSDSEDWVADYGMARGSDGTSLQSPTKLSHRKTSELGERVQKQRTTN